MEQSEFTDANQSHDPSVWVDEYGDPLYRYALSRLRDPEGAAEMVQQTFLAGLEHQSQFSGAGSQQGWLMGILKRKIIDFVRQRNRSAQSDDLDARDPLDSYFDRTGSWKKSVRETLLEPLDSVDREEFWRYFKCAWGRCLSGNPVRLFSEKSRIGKRQRSVRNWRSVRRICGRYYIARVFVSPTA